MMNRAVLELCQRFPDARRDQSLADVSFWRIGGLADCFWDATSVSDLLEFMSLSRRLSLPVCVIGRTTNILFDDAGFRGCIVRLGPGLARFGFDGDRLEATCGCWTPRLALEAARRGLAGMEHCIGIPASFGGLLYMNGGSLRRSISEIVHSVCAISSSGEVRSMDASQCDFSYRHSRFQERGEVVVSAVLKFPARKPYAEQRKDLLRILGDRRRKFPRKLPTCGSTFKSSPELFEAYGPPGKVIEDMGFKGRRVGGALVSPLHANFIVNTGTAKSVDVLSLVREIRGAVRAGTGLDIVPEFKYLHPTLGICEGGSL